MAKFFDGTDGMDNVKDIYNKMKKIALILLDRHPKNFGNFGAHATLLLTIRSLKQGSRKPQLC